MKKKKNVFFTLLIFILILLPLTQIFLNIIPSNFFENDSTISIFPKYYDGQLNDFDIESNPIYPQDKLDPYIDGLLKNESMETSIPIIIFLNHQPGMKIAFKLKFEQKLTENGEYYRKLYELTKEEIQSSQNALISQILSLDGVLKRKFSIINAISIEMPLKNINFLLTNPNVAKIAYDHILKANLAYSVPSMTQDPPNSWNYTYNGSNIVVAVLDTGINESHPALVNTVIDSYNVITGDTNADDDNFHGTYVAGIIANRDPISHGVAPNVSLINVKVLDHNGEGPSSWLMAGVEWVLTRAATRPDIINFSGGVPVSQADHGLTALTIFVDAITTMFKVLWINAAGNTPSLIELPADAYNSIAVGGLYDEAGRDVNRNDDKVDTSYSSRGPTTDGRMKPDIVAMGTYVNSCWYTGGWKDNKLGTSFSAPHISGAAALIYEYLDENREIDRSFYPLVTKALLLCTADDWRLNGPGTNGPDNNTGFGYVNLANTWNLLDNGVFIETNSLSYDHIKYNQPFYYNLTLNQDEILNLTLIWNRNALYSGGFVFIYGNGRPNDLNLYLLNSSNHILANSTDPKNNIEQISYTIPKNGSYYLQIICQDSQFLASEPYVLISSHDLSEVNPSKPQILFYSLSPQTDVDLDHFFFKNFDAFEKISFYIFSYDEDGILGGTFNMPFIRQLFLPQIDINWPMFLIPPNILFFNVILQDLFIETGWNRLFKTLLDGTIYATITIFDNHPIIKTSSTFYCIIEYHGFIWNLSFFAISLLSILIIVDFIREKRAKKILNELSESKIKKIPLEEAFD